MIGIFSRFNNPRHIRILVLGALILAGYIGAISRGESTLWFIAALLVATLITSFVWPRWLVSQLSVTRIGPERANEDDVIVFRVEIFNRGALPRFMIELVDQLPFIGAATGNAILGDRLLGVVTYIGGDSQVQFEVPLICEKRGLYKLGPVSLSSSFPLGLAEAKNKSQNGIQSLLIYPSVFPIMSLPLHGAPSQIHRGGFLLPEATGTAEFCGLREYRRGDNPRHIHWPTSARLNELMIREFEPMAAASLCLALNLETNSNIGTGRHSTFEYSMKIAASIAQYVCTSGMPVRMIGHGTRTLNIPPGSGEGHYRELLEGLAILDADGNTPYAHLLETQALECEPGETMVVFLSQTGTELESTLQSLALLRNSGVHILAINFICDTFATITKKTNLHMNKNISTDSLLELGATCINIRNGDNLSEIFNT